jgi:DNA-binding protein YbaB
MNQKAMMKQIQQMQAAMATAQEELAVLEVTGQAGNGLVTATCTAAGEWRSLLAALNDAKAQAEAAQQSRLGPLTSGINLPGF